MRDRLSDPLEWVMARTGTDALDVLTVLCVVVLLLFGWTVRGGGR